MQHWSQPAARAAGAEHQVERRRRFAKQRTGEKAGRIGEVGMVQEVEHLQAKQQGTAFGQLELATQGDVDLVHPKTPNRIPSQGPLGRPQCRLKGVGVEPPAARRARLA